MQSAFVDRLDELRDRLEFPLRVSSGYRCPAHNARVSSTGLTGPHTTGLAADLAVERWAAYEVLRVALEMRFQGIGVAQKGAARFIHLDDVIDGRPTVWSY